MAELSPADADALGIGDGDRIEVGNGKRVPATAKLRAAVPAGSVFLAEGTRENGANLLTGGLVELHRVGAGLARAQRDRRAGRAWPIEGLSEMPASAPLPIPPREVT